MPKPDTHVPNRFAAENPFRGAAPEDAPLPAFAAARPLLPSPIWEGHADAIACYWKVWEIAFRNLRHPAPGSGFVANFIDTAFNGCLFMWDSAFIVMFARYGSRAFPFQHTLDNLYAFQHADGFICREIDERSGEERFERHDPASTGPNVLPWAEWEYWLNFSDRERLARIFPVLVAYYQWTRAYRTWPDGLYWTSGWGCGMDNQPRLQSPDAHVNFSHDHMVWIDATLQAILAGRQLLAMAQALGRAAEIADIAAEVARLSEQVNAVLWDDAAAFYFDRWRDGTLSGVKTIGAYWALLAGIVPPERLTRFVDHLRNPAEFARPHRVPTLSADHPLYDPAGDYWRGSIWAPTNYMVLRGLSEAGQEDLAYEIALNHLENVVEVYRQTGTVWENYAPERADRGSIAGRDFVGWTGLPPVAVLLEYVFGLRPDVPHGRLVWRVNRLEAHGVERYPFGPAGLLDLHCAARSLETEEPQVTVDATVPLELELLWPGGRKLLRL